MTLGNRLIFFILCDLKNQNDRFLVHLKKNSQKLNGFSARIKHEKKLIKETRNYLKHFKQNSIFAQLHFKNQ